MMVRPTRTPVLLSFALVLGARLPLAAQMPRRAARAESGDSVERQLRRLERRADSLVRIYDDNDLVAAERRAVGDSLDRTMAQIDSLARNLGASARPAAARFRIELPSSMMGTFVQTRGDERLAPRGWLGIVVSGPAREPRVENGEIVVRYLQHPVIVSVDPSSPAERAGLVPSDTLLAYDGRDVSENDISLARLLRPNARVLVRVRRDGRTKEVPVTIADVPSRIKMQRELSFVRVDPPVEGLPEPMRFSRMPRRAVGSPMTNAGAMTPLPPSVPLPPLGPTPGTIYNYGLNSIAGAQLVSITEGLAKTIGIAYGLLVTVSPYGSPANQSGLKDGDVIVKADGEPIRTIAALRERVRAAAENGERTVDLEIVRDRRPQKVTLRWSGVR